MAHELGHYYFGTVISPNATLRWAFLEGMTEYLSLQATRTLMGNALYERQLKKYIANSKDMKNFIPLSDITIASQIGETYRYQYIPLLLTALERQVGQEQVWKWFRTILNKKDPTTDYDFFKNSLLESGVPEETVTTFDNTYLTGDKSLRNLLDLVKSNSPDYYYWGIATEIPKKDDSKKRRAFYTTIKRIKRDDDELKRVTNQYFAYAKNHCNTDNKLASSDFNYYDTLEEAQQARANWIKKKGDTYTMNQVDF